MGLPMTPDLMQHAESVMDAALASYALPLYSEALALSGAPQDHVAAAAAAGEAQRAAVNAAAWATNASGVGWYKRAWLSTAYPGEWLGAADNDNLLWTETQSWALLGGVPQASEDSGRAQALVGLLNAAVRDPSPIGAINSAPDRTVDGGVGYGGVWACGDVALVSALGLRGWPDLALEEWRKSSLATHAEVYPYIYFGATAGNDVTNSVYAAAHNATPGSTRCSWNAPGVQNPCAELSFPILNAWPHTLGTFTIPALFGAEWDAEGLLLRPGLTVEEEYTFFTPLVSLSHWGGRGSCSFAGAWAPALPAESPVVVRVALRSDDKAACTGLVVNGLPAALVWGSEGEVVIKGSLQAVEGVPLLAWELESARTATYPQTT